MTTKWHSRSWGFGLASVLRFVLFSIFFVINIYIIVVFSFIFSCGTLDTICGVNRHDILVNLFSPVSLAYWTNTNPNDSSIQVGKDNSPHSFTFSLLWTVGFLYSFRLLVTKYFIHKPSSFSGGCN